MEVGFGGQKWCADGATRAKKPKKGLASVIQGPAREKEAERTQAKKRAKKRQPRDFSTNIQAKNKANYSNYGA